MLGQERLDVDANALLQVAQGLRPGLLRLLQVNEVGTFDRVLHRPELLKQLDDAPEIDSAKPLEFSL